MAKLSWPDFVVQHTTGHLIIAAVPDLKDRVAINRLLAKLLERLNPTGDYATVIVRDADLEIHIGFQKQSEADRLAKAVQATPIDRYPGWSSQRHFVLTPIGVLRARAL